MIVHYMAIWLSFLKCRHISKALDFIDYHITLNTFLNTMI